jgi:hypothetical protein
MAEIGKQLVSDLRAHGVAVSGAGADPEHDHDDEHGLLKFEADDAIDDEHETEAAQEAMREFIRAVAAEMFA